MPITTTCIWCGDSLNAERASKKVCSDSCRMAFKRWTERLHIQNTTAFLYMDAIRLFNGVHPNPNYNKESHNNNENKPMPVLQ